MSQRTVILLFAFARSGGTLLNRYLAGDTRLVCLSEINSKYTCPTEPNTVSEQLRKWYSMEISSVDILTDITSALDKSIKNGRNFVIRDWSFGSFVPLKYNGYIKSGNLNTYYDLTALPNVRVVPVALMRHPFDVWLSMASSEKPFHDRKLEFYFRFCNEVVKNRIPRLAYEDLCRSPASFLASLYERVGLEFVRVPLLSDRVTGDINFPRSSRGALLDHAQQLHRRGYEADDLIFYQSETRGPQIESMLGYESAVKI